MLRLNFYFADENFVITDVMESLMLRLNLYFADEQFLKDVDRYQLSVETFSGKLESLDYQALFWECKVFEYSTGANDYKWSVLV